MFSQSRLHQMVGRVSFIPINRGLEFYDRYTGDPAEDNPDKE